MNIKQLGDFLEVECCGCGEPLLVGDGESVNVRIKNLRGDDGEETPVPDGFLCFVCHKMEGKSGEDLIRFQKKKCCGCGKLFEDDDENFYPKFRDGKFHGFFCSKCF